MAKGQEARSGDDDPPRGAWSETRVPGLRLDPTTLRGSDPDDVLVRLVEDDPLDLDIRCRRRRSELAFLISHARLVMRTAARVAYSGHDYEGVPPVEDWLVRCIDTSVREILDEDESGVLRESAVEYPEDYEALVHCFDFTPVQARAACVSFNGLEPTTREAFCALAIEGTALEQYAGLQGDSPAAIVPKLQLAVAALLGDREVPPDGDLAIREWPADW